MLRIRQKASKDHDLIVTPGDLFVETIWRQWSAQFLKEGGVEKVRFMYEIQFRWGEKNVDNLSLWFITIKTERIRVKKKMSIARRKCRRALKILQMQYVTVNSGMPLTATWKSTKKHQNVVCWKSRILTMSLPTHIIPPCSNVPLKYPLPTSHVEVLHVLFLEVILHKFQSSWRLTSRKSTSCCGHRMFSHFNRWEIQKIWVKR